MIVADPNTGFSIIKKSIAKTIQIDLSTYINSNSEFLQMDQRLIGYTKQPKLNMIYKFKLSIDNTDDIKKSIFQSKSESGSNAFLKTISKSNEYLDEMSDGDDDDVEIVAEVNSDEDEEFDTKMINSLEIGTPGTPSGYGSDDDDLIDDDDLLKLSVSVMLSNKTPKEQNYAIMFNLTNELVEKSNKMTTVKIKIKLTNFKKLIEKHILPSEDIEKFLNSNEELVIKLRKAYELIFNDSFKSKEDFIEKMEYYQTDPVPLQKIDLGKILPFFKENDENFIDRKEFKDDFKLASDLNIFLTELFFFSTNYHKNMETIVFGKK